MDNDFRIALTGEAVPLLFQLPPEFLKVVDLAIGDQPDRPVLVADGLAALLAQVDDGQAPVAQRDALGAVFPLLVRPPVRQTLGHPLHQGGIAPGHSTNSTHARSTCTRLSVAPVRRRKSGGPDVKSGKITDCPLSGKESVAPGARRSRDQRRFSRSLVSRSTCSRTAVFCAIFWVMVLMACRTVEWSRR